MMFLVSIYIAKEKKGKIPKKEVSDIIIHGVGLTVTEMHISTYKVPLLVF
jgi:hypothetical protein